MVIEIDKRIPLMPICRDDFGRRCIHNGNQCNCSIYSGNTKLPLNFHAEAR